MTRAGNKHGCTGVYHSYATRDIADHRGPPRRSHSDPCDILHRVSWTRIDKGGLSLSGSEDKARCDKVMNKHASSRQAASSRVMYKWESGLCMLPEQDYCLEQKTGPRMGKFCVSHTDSE